jgi:hypothetical protein
MPSTNITGCERLTKMGIWFYKCMGNYAFEISSISGKHLLEPMLCGYLFVKKHLVLAISKALKNW